MIPAPEVQAILALCHHEAHNSECVGCLFRQGAAMEHLRGLVAGAIASVEEVAK